MNPFRLTGTTPDGREAKVWGCGVCLHVCLNEEHAKRCCVCSYCGKPTDNAEDRGKRQTYHRSCMHADWIRKYQERLDKATEVTDYDGPFLYNDRFHADMGELLDYLECSCESDEDWPEWIYACTEQKPCLTLDLDDLSHKIEDLWEDADWSEFAGHKELEAAFAAFNEANKERASYTEDWTRKVRVPRPEAGGGK